MDPSAAELAASLTESAGLLRSPGLPPPRPRPYLVAVAGIPGSGKTTLAADVVRWINTRCGREAAACLPMDGFHLTRAQLDAMEDPAAAHRRRGAPWTFDGAAYVAAAARLRRDGALVAPAWDHATKDPTPGGIRIGREHGVVLLEGNYLLLDEEPWRDLRPLVDECWMIECDVEAAMRRVAARAVAAGIEPTVERAWARVDGNDRPNAHAISAHSIAADRVVRWASPE